MLFLYIFLLFFEGTAEVKSPSVWGDYRQEVSGSLQFAREIVVPEKLRGLYKQKKIRVFAIDLDSDKKTDYIVHEVGAYNTCYFSHAFERKNCEKLGYSQGGFDCRFFAQLDSDPMLAAIIHKFGVSVDFLRKFRAESVFRYDYKASKLVEPNRDEARAPSGNSSARRGLYICVGAGSQGTVRWDTDGASVMRRAFVRDKTMPGAPRCDEKFPEPGHRF